MVAKDDGMDEIKSKIDGLSLRAKQWLNHAASALGEGERYINHAPSRAECRKAGLITQKPFGRIEISAELMDLLDVQGYLRGV